MLSLDEMKALASLAKLDFLDETRLVKLQTQINNIFQYIDKLKEVELDSSNPERPTVNSNRFQANKADVNFDVEKFLKRVPKNNGRYIVTDKVL